MGSILIFASCVVGIWPCVVLLIGDRRWPQTVREEGGKLRKRFSCNIRKKRDEDPKVGGVSFRSKNSAPSPQGCVVNGQMIKASNK